MCVNLVVFVSGQGNKLKETQMRKLLVYISNVPITFFSRKNNFLVPMAACRQSKGKKKQAIQTFSQYILEQIIQQQHKKKIKEKVHYKTRNKKLRNNYQSRCRNKQQGLESRSSNDEAATLESRYSDIMPKKYRHIPLIQYIKETGVSIFIQLFLFLLYSLPPAICFLNCCTQIRTHNYSGCSEKRRETSSPSY